VLTESKKARLLDLLRANARGLSRAQIQSQLGLNAIGGKQFRRALAPLIAEGLVRTEGSTRALKYFAADSAPAAETIPLSSGARALLERLRRPIHLRRPTSYRRALLDEYRPNKTWLLDADLRRRLHELGRTGYDDQPAGTYARKILERLLIDLSWNSSRLEGNTYSLLETEKLLLAGEAAPARNAEERQMVLNHKQAIEFLVESGPSLRLDEGTLRNLHALLADNLLSNSADAGRLRTNAVEISGSVFVPLANPQLISEVFHQLVATAAAIDDPFEQSFFLLVHLPYLQPFIDGNKRTARLASNLPFIRKNLAPLSFVDVPREPFLLGVLGVYEEQRVELLREVFVFAYERSAARYRAVRESLGEPDPFRLQFRTQLKDAVGHVVRENLAATRARQWLGEFVLRLPEESRARFLSVVETELAALHDGNFARYRVTPGEFTRWHARRRR
jgi:Fic family protein